MPTAAVNPLTWLGILRRRFDHRDDLIPGLRVSELQVQLRFANAGKVPVALDEPWNNQLSGGVNPLRL